ncbi:MAG: hypothetical protein A3G81_20860 [Betaproteobacteria bacterium RIFCSPLOWO2_12_FULL_65_14]|nr:MAG: hypothetical protein A3G81_20860 [Betaproteobacteria bacterium RIFCSPLOWO2_12_FULL_65_14]
MAPDKSMRWRVLVSAPYAMPVIETYRSRLEAASCEVVVAEVRERLTEEQLLPLVKDIDGAICGDDRFTERVMLAAPRLRVLLKWGTGIAPLDQEGAKCLGVRIYNTPGAFSEPVADTVPGYILLFARQFGQMDRDIREGRWIERQLVASRETTLGAIGVGDCGRAVVRRAVAFGMRVLGMDIVEIPADFSSGLTGLDRKRAVVRW